MSHEQTAPFSARERQQNKTAQDHLNDFAFLLTHFITCTVTDPLTGPVSEWAENHIDMSLNKQHGFQFSVNPFRDVPKEDETLTEWVLAEIIADMGSVPATMAVQHFAPEVMEAIRTPLEAVFGDMYEKSAEKAAVNWADKHHIRIASEEFLEYKQAHYEKEMAHAPQAFMWSALSIAANVAIQKMVLPAVTNNTLGNDKPTSKLVASNIFGTAITGLIANGMRLAAPRTIDHVEHEVGEFAEKKIVTPLTRIIGNTIGVERDMVSAKQDEVHL